MSYRDWLISNGFGRDEIPACDRWNMGDVADDVTEDVVTTLQDCDTHESGSLAGHTRTVIVRA